MPWCDDCAKFWNPNSLPPDGTCPTCGRLIADPPAGPKVPWHFWLLLLGSRALPRLPGVPGHRLADQPLISR